MLEPALGAGDPLNLNLNLNLKVKLGRWDAGTLGRWDAGTLGRWVKQDSSTGGAARSLVPTTKGTLKQPMLL
jgi:hypothetical protein